MWDIGCDHGLLGLSFLDNPEVSTVHLVDPSQLVINELKLKLDDSDIPNLKKIKIHHKKGQEIILGTMRKVVFVAGMGGEEIIEILAHLEEQLSVDDQIIISPHRKILETRLWLSQSKFRLEQELIIYDKKQYYQAISLGLNPNAPKVGLYGDLMWKGELAHDYKIKEMNYLKCHQDGPSQAYFAYLKSLSC